jgi:hypothetical protein
VLCRRAHTYSLSCTRPVLHEACPAAVLVVACPAAVLSCSGAHEARVLHGCSSQAPSCTARGAAVQAKLHRVLHNARLFKPSSIYPKPYRPACTARGAVFKPSSIYAHLMLSSASRCGCKSRAGSTAHASMSDSRPLGNFHFWINNAETKFHF